MKTKTKIVGLAIGTGVLASLLVAGVGFQGQTFDTPETSAATILRLPIDMDQELGSSDTEVRVARSQDMVFDAAQELGSSDTEVRVARSQNMVFDAAQELGSSDTEVRAARSQDMIFDASQELGSSDTN